MLVLIGAWAAYRYTVVMPAERAQKELAEATKAIDVLHAEALKAVREPGAKEKIEAIAKKSVHVKEVRGKGLFIGVEVKKGNAMEFCRKLMKERLIVKDSHGHTIRISPPLIINDEEMDFMVERLERVLVP